jgi:phage terminase small subunit
VRVLATEFGLTPSSRGRIDTGVRARDDDGINPFAG